MTEVILNKIEEKRMITNEGVTRYEQIDKKIKKAIRETKYKWMQEQCTEIKARKKIRLI